MFHQANYTGTRTPNRYIGSFENQLALFHKLLYPELRVVDTADLPVKFLLRRPNQRSVELLVWQSSLTTDPNKLAMLLAALSNVPIAGVQVIPEHFLVTLAELPRQRPRDRWESVRGTAWRLPVDTQELMEMTGATMRNLLGIGEGSRQVVQRVPRKIYLEVAPEDVGVFLAAVNHRVLQDLNGWFWVACNRREQEVLYGYLAQLTDADALRHAVLPRHCVNVEVAHRSYLQSLAEGHW